MRKDLFIDTASLDLTDAERKKNELDVFNVNPEIGKVKSMAIAYLRIANYLLNYRTLAIKTDFFDDKVIVVRNNEKFSTQKAYAIINPPGPMQTSVLDFYSTQSHDIFNFSYIYQNAQFRYPDRMEPIAMNHYNITHELLLNSMTILTPIYTAHPIEVEIELRNTVQQSGTPAGSAAAAVDTTYETFIKTKIDNNSEENHRHHFIPNVHYELVFAGTLQIILPPGQGLSIEKELRFTQCITTESIGEPLVESVTVTFTADDVVEWCRKYKFVTIEKNFRDSSEQLEWNSLVRNYAILNGVFDTNFPNGFDSRNPEHIEIGRGLIDDPRPPDDEDFAFFTVMSYDDPDISNMEKKENLQAGIYGGPGVPVSDPKDTMFEARFLMFHRFFYRFTLIEFLDR